MSLWYQICDFLPFEMLQWNFMKNALLAIILITPLLGFISTMIVTGKMSFFSDALGHSAFTGIAIGAILGFAAPTWVAVICSIVFALLFSYVRTKSNQAADTLIGVFSSTAIALGIFIATLDGGSFTKYNRYIIGDILSVTPNEIDIIAIVFLLVATYWVLASNRLILCSLHPQLAASRNMPTNLTQTVFTVAVAVIVTLSISWVGLLILNSLLVLPAATSRNIARNMKQYHLFSVLIAIFAGLIGLLISYALGTSTGASISLILAAFFLISFFFRKVRA